MTELRGSPAAVLKQSALAAAGLAVGIPFLQAGGRRLGPALRTVPAAAAKSKVVWIHHSKVIDAAGRVEAPLLQEMLDKALTEFTGRGSIADAWRQFVKPEDIVGLKLNTLGLSSIRAWIISSTFRRWSRLCPQACKSRNQREESGRLGPQRGGDEGRRIRPPVRSRLHPLYGQQERHARPGRQLQSDRHPVGSKSSG